MTQRFSGPSNILGIPSMWPPFVKCCLPFIIKTSCYSLHLPSEVLKCITSGNKTACNFIAQINSEPACPATQNLIHGWAQSNLQDTWCNCHLPPLTNNAQSSSLRFFWFVFCFFFRFFWVVWKAFWLYYNFLVHTELLHGTFKWFYVLILPSHFHFLSPLVERAPRWPC